MVAAPASFSTLASLPSAASEAEAGLRPVRVRYAPSPTGSLHLGGLRTALYNYVFAKRFPGGKCILRIEDTDQTRLVPGAVEQLQRDLAWAGLHFDEGPGALGGPHGPYAQSERLPLYERAAAELMRAGHAYRCFCTPERLETVRANQMKRGAATTYDRLCAGLSQDESDARAAAGDSFVVRMKVPDREAGVTVVRDEVRGEVRFLNKVIDDQVLMKSDGFPTYHLANIVDDHDMRITHVIRGEEWLPSAAKHVLLYQMFGWPAPAFAHLPLLLRPDGSKLSKRYRDSSLDYYMSLGYLRDAVVNFVTFLGWHPASATAAASAAETDTTAAAADATDAAGPAQAPLAAAAASAAAGGAALSKTDIAALRAALGGDGAAGGKKKKGAAASSNVSAAPVAAAAAASASTAVAVAAAGAGSLFSASASAQAEELSIAATVPLFSLAQVQRSGATVSLDKLQWFHNHYWKKALSSPEGVAVLSADALPYVAEQLDAFAAAAAAAGGAPVALPASPHQPVASASDSSAPASSEAAAAPAAVAPGAAAAPVFFYPALTRDPRSDEAALALALKTTRDHPCLLAEFPAAAFFAWARPHLADPRARACRDSFWISDAVAAAAAVVAGAAPDAAAASASASAAAPAARGKKRGGAGGKVVATRAVLAAARALIASLPEAVFSGFDVERLVGELKALAAAQGVPLKEVYLPLRFALSGGLAGPGVADQLCAVGQAEALVRVQAAIDLPDEASAQ